MLYLLDTDTVSYAVKETHPQLTERLDSVPFELVSISVITQAELLYGLRRISGMHPVQQAVRGFLSTVRILPWLPQAAEFYAEIRYQLRSSGRTIGELDMMIAAHALSAGAILVTNNVRHFERIALPLKMENWADG
jgi:tRNA(fMet)-specific endonuclease VapC